AESAAQMRRVIVDQIEALAELNRIVARHGRGMDAQQSEPVRRAQPEESVVVSMGGRMPRPVARGDITGAPAPMPPPPVPAPANECALRREEALRLSARRGVGTGMGAGMGRPPAGRSRGAGAGGGAGGGWLTDLLNRASREDGPRPDDRPRMDDRLPMMRDDRPPPRDDRAARNSIQSLDPPSGDIPPLIDHHAA